jgi:NAD+ kinase
MSAPTTMPPIRKIAFVVNDAKDGAPELTQALMAIAEKNGATVKHTGTFAVTPGFLKGQDACCVIGGDGTLLGVAAEAARENVPVIGVNRGSLGFLTTFSAEEARSNFAELLNGAYQLNHRSMLDCFTGSGSHDIALNDVLIKDEVNSRLAGLEVYADGELVTHYICDGLIFSTPTGSTAYNLSAGGPIIHPGAEVIAMTPICPHTLTNRTIIFRHDVKLRVTSSTPGARLLVAMDGQRNLMVGVGSAIEISISPLRLALALRPDYSHFSVVRTKLKWSGSLVDRKN